jgi:WXXGXW repeat (2 copies)
MRIATAIRSLILATAVSAIPAASFAGIFVSIGIGAPPVLPVYAQPICPAPGYIWTPGYWSYDDQAGYYWVPGAWVLAPYEGALWTPGYWGWGNGGYLWHVGYWGPHVGFYGGVNYGFGYSGRGFDGGYWDRGRFRYNTAVMHVDGARFHDNVYNQRVVIRNENRVSYNGGHGGIDARPSREEEGWGREQHTAPLGAQHQNEMRASQNRAQFANVNHGRPENLARTEPASYNHTVPMNNRPMDNRPANNGLMTNSPAHNAPITNANRPAAYNNGQRPQAYNQNPGQPQAYHPQSNMQMNQHTQPQSMRAPATQSYHPQSNMQMNQHTQPQQMRAPAPQQSHPAPSHSNGGGHEGGGHGGRSR